MNKSKELRDLFRQSLINERIRPKDNYVKNYPIYVNETNFTGGVHRIPSQYNDDSIRIYFYEWSDLNKAPRIFYQLDAFDNFLKSSGIYMEFYEREIIKNLETVYITCYTGTRNLSIRSTYKSLLDSLHEYEASKLVCKKDICKIILAPQGRQGKVDGSFFG
jgi:hypothetical protein